MDIWEIDYLEINKANWKLIDKYILRLYSYCYKLKFWFSLIINDYLYLNYYKFISIICYCNVAFIWKQ